MKQQGKLSPRLYIYFLGKFSFQNCGQGTAGNYKYPTESMLRTLPHGLFSFSLSKASKIVNLTYYIFLFFKKKPRKI